MNVDVVARDGFIHGNLVAQRGGDVLKNVPRFVAEDLERAGLVEIREASAPSSPEAVTGKSTAVGEEQPSSASPAAPASPETTSNTSDAGKRRGRPPGASSSSIRRSG